MADAISPEEIQKQTDAANKLRDLAKAKKDQLDAEKALQDAQRLPPPEKPPTAGEKQRAEQVAVAKVATELANAQKAASEAAEANSKAAAEALKARFGGVPEAGIDAGVTAGDGTGKIEAALLSAKAVRKAVVRINNVVRKVAPKGTTIAVMAVSEVPSFQHLVAYQANRELVRTALEQAIERAHQVPEQGLNQELADAGLLSGAGLVLDSVTKLLSFFGTEFTVSGVEVATDDLVAVVEAANALAQTVGDTSYSVIVPALYNAKAIMDAGAFVRNDVAALAGTRQAADSLAKRHDAKADLLAKLAADAQDPSAKQQFEQEANGRKGVATSLQGAIALFDQWWPKLTVPDEKGAVPLVAIARERAIHEQVGETGYLLVLKVQHAGGGFFTKKNLWTFLGEMPLYHMGGAAVTFMLLDGKSGQVRASGMAPVYGGFVKSSDVATALVQ